MQKARFIQKALRPTGSEAATSHLGTYNMDFSYGTDQWVYAPFDCKVRNIYHSSKQNANTTWFESIDIVEGPKFKDYQTFFLSHMYDADFAAFGLEEAWKSGKIFKQGEKIYKAGMQGNATGVHIHVSWGRGKFTGTGWHSVPSGAWCINNNVHIYDALYIPLDIPHITTNNPADKYPWVREPKVVYAQMQLVNNLAVDTKATVVRVRDNPGLQGSQIATLPLNARIRVVEKSAAPCDGYDWIKVQFDNIVGYSAIIPTAMALVDITPPTISVVVDNITETEVYFTWNADRACTQFEVSLDLENWTVKLADVESWNKKKIIGLTQDTAYTLFFRAKSTTGVFGLASVQVKTKAVDPTAELKQQLAAAQATISAQTTIIKEKDGLILNQKEELNSFQLIDKPIYSKA